VRKLRYSKRKEALCQKTSTDRRRADVPYLANEKPKQVLGDLEAELGQGVLELSAVDGPRSVLVETPEYMLPVLLCLILSSFSFFSSDSTTHLNVSPKARELRGGSRE
jgi:hypothetical protein